MVTIDDVRAVVKDLPRSYEAFVRGRVKFRVGRIVYLDFSRDQTIMSLRSTQSGLAITDSAKRPESVSRPLLARSARG